MQHDSLIVHSYHTFMSHTFHALLTISCICLDSNKPKDSAEEVHMLAASKNEAKSANQVDAEESESEGDQNPESEEMEEQNDDLDEEDEEGDEGEDEDSDGDDDDEEDDEEDDDESTQGAGARKRGGQGRLSRKKKATSRKLWQQSVSCWLFDNQI